MESYKSFSKCTCYSGSSLEIIYQCFQEGCSDVYFIVRRKISEAGEKMILSVTEIFYNDELLEQFGSRDVRTIVYFATCKLLASENKLFQKVLH